MNSPADPASPSSTSSSSLPPEDIQLIDQFAPSGFPHPSELQTSLAKRRLPATGAHTRESKTRKKDDTSGRRQGQWTEMQGGTKQKDELVDTDVVERLRKGRCSQKQFATSVDDLHFRSEFGDPFDESSLKTLS